MPKIQGSVAQGWVNAIEIIVNANYPRLKFNLLFWFKYFCTSVYFKTSEKKTPTDFY
jgi:hypothetical protein